MKRIFAPILGKFRRIRGIIRTSPPTGKRESAVKKDDAPRMTKEKNSARAESILTRWMDKLPSRKRVNRGDIAGGLVILERLKADFNLDIQSHLTPNGYQLQGASALRVGEILKRHGETRPLAKEGGRTNRGLLANLRFLLDLLGKENIGALSGKARNELLDAMQDGLARRAVEVLNAKKLPFHLPREMTTHDALRRILDAANARGKEGEVAQHLVGAKLALRFPNIKIENRSASAADESGGHAGDFFVGDTVFHVTVSPNHGHYDKCDENLDGNLRVYLLVSNGILFGVRTYVATRFGGRVAVESYESFISQNIEELSEFSGNKIRNGFLRLLETYNDRVREVEADLSLLVDTPKF